jgi:hypothetical protein
MKLFQFVGRSTYRSPQLKEAFFLDDLSNFSPAVRLHSEGRATGPPEDRYRLNGGRL